MEQNIKASTVVILFRQIEIVLKDSTAFVYVRGHAQTMWTAMGGGGVHEMSTLLIKPHYGVP